MACEEASSCGVFRCEVRRRINSTSSAGREGLVACDFEDLEEEEDAETSRLRTAFRIICCFAARMRSFFNSCDLVSTIRDCISDEMDLTSFTTSHSFWAGWYFVDPEWFRKLDERVAWRAANLGLLRSIESSIGGNIVMLSAVPVLWNRGLLMFWTVPRPQGWSFDEAEQADAELRFQLNNSSHLSARVHSSDEQQTEKRPLHVK